MSFSDVLKHRAFPYKRAVTSTWVEGERVVTGGTVAGTQFRCVLFLPSPGSENVVPTYVSPKRILQPTLLYWPRDTLGGPVALSAEDEVGVVARELNVAQGLDAASEVRWLVEGQPQAFGPPGRRVIGFQATLQRIAE